ncbi:MAG: DUF6929 family protein [Sulfurifustaceae bacterium]
MVCARIGKCAIASLAKIRDLTLHEASAPGRPKHLSAASGLVIVKSWLYVVADDEHHLGVFAAEGDAPGDLIRIIDGDLPEGKKDRKRRKPDFEALLLLPPFSHCAHGALLAVGSGSRENRGRGVLLSLDEQGRAGAAPRVIDLSRLFAPIERQINGLNIEGATVVSDRLILLQRGNKRDGVNALISLALGPVLRSLATGDTVDRIPFTVRPCDLGSIHAVPLTFTDAATLPDGRIVFTAVAEDTDDSYLDGACAGAAVGILGADGDWQRIERLHPDAKVEGIDARLSGDRIRLLLVSDADDARIPASLYAAEIGV